MMPIQFKLFVVRSVKADKLQLVDASDLTCLRLQVAACMCLMLGPRFEAELVDIALVLVVGEKMFFTKIASHTGYGIHRRIFNIALLLEL